MQCGSETQPVAVSYGKHKDKALAFSQVHASLANRPSSRQQTTPLWSHKTCLKREEYRAAAALAATCKHDAGSEEAATQAVHAAIGQAGVGAAAGTAAATGRSPATATAAATATPGPAAGASATGGSAGPASHPIDVDEFEPAHVDAASMSSTKLSPTSKAALQRMSPGQKEVVAALLRYDIATRGSQQRSKELSLMASCSAEQWAKLEMAIPIMAVDAALKVTCDKRGRQRGVAPPRTLLQQLEGAGGGPAAGAGGAAGAFAGAEAAEAQGTTAVQAAHGRGGSFFFAMGRSASRALRATPLVMPQRQAAPAAAGVMPSVRAVAAWLLPSGRQRVCSRPRQLPLRQPCMALLVAAARMRRWRTARATAAMLAGAECRVHAMMVTCVGCHFY